MELFSSCCGEINIHIDLRRLSQGISVKVSQATCTVCCGTKDKNGDNEGEMSFISSWFGVHRAILHSCGDISVHLVLWQCSWGLSGVPSRKSMFLTCLIGNTGLLWTQCKGIEPHLQGWGMSHGISRVAARTCYIFPSYSGDVHSKLHFVQQSQDACLVTTDTTRT